MNYESCASFESAVRPGVSYTVRRMSVGRRAELTRKLRDLMGKIEFLAAGGDPKEQIEAALLSNEVEKAYLEWGLVEVRGLEIDGQAASCESLVAAGPEDLCREIAAAIKAEAGLTADERKN